MSQPEYNMQRQIDQLDGKVDRVGEQIASVKDLLNEKLNRMEVTADTDRRNFQQSLRIIGGQVERNTTSMSSNETEVALVRAEEANLRRSVETISNRLWWAIGVIFVALVGVATDFFKSLPN